MTPRHIIQPEDRGRKPRLDPSQPTERYIISLPRSLWMWLRRIGAKRVRQILQEAHSDND